MRGRLTTDHIFTVRQIIEKYYEYGQNVHTVFIDFKQANNNVNRQLWTALRNFRIPEKLVKMMEICNSNIFCNVRYRDHIVLNKWMILNTLS